MGVTLALVLVLTVGAAFLPANTPGGPTEAEAGDLTWSTTGIPSTTGSTLVAAGENVGPVAISPDFANDHTVFAAINVSAATGYAVVAKSTNGGHTWSRTTTNLGTVAGDPIVALAVSPNYASDSTLFVAVQDVTGAILASNGRVYRSTNGGATFTQLGVVTLAANEMITSMDVSPDYDGVGTIAIGVASITDSTYTTATFGVQVWGSGGVLNWTAFGGTLNGDVTAVKFSPNYPIDSTLLAVVSNGTAGTVLHTRVGSNAWDATIGGPATVATAAVGADDMDTAGPGGVRYADIALPQDYNGTISTQRRAYVTWATDNVAAVAAGFGDVYRVTNVSTAFALTAGVQLSDLDYNGTYAEGTLIGALYSDTAGTNADMYRTTNPTSSVVNWYAATNRPAGLEATGAAPTGWSVMSADFANDSTVIFGSTSTESAFSISTDGAVTWNETGLIENAGVNLATLGDLVLSPDYANDSTIYLLSNWTSGGTSDTALWRRTSQYGSNYWDMVHWANFLVAGTGVIAISNEYATDATVYFGDSATVNVFYSGTGGDIWSTRTIAAGIGVLVGTMAAPDATTLYVGDSASGTVAKSTNSGWVWPSSQSKPSGGTVSVADMKVDGSTIVIGCGDGTVRRSDDSGTNWSKVGATLTAAVVYVAFDGTTVYAIESGTGDTFRSVDGGDWVDTGGLTDGANAVDMVLAPDGTLYYAEGAGQDVNRSINPTADVPTPNVTFQSMGAAAVNITAMDAVSAGSNIVAIIDATPRVRMYTDILSAGSAGPTLVSPDDGSTLTRGTGTPFTVVLQPGVTTYSVYAATDEGFTKPQSWSPVVITPPAVSSAAQTLTEGVTIYWRVRATAPFNGPYSEVWTVHTQVVTAAVAPVPGYPANEYVMNISTSPVFNWSSFKYASGYEMQLAKDADMTDFVADLTGANALGNITSWKCTTTLDYSTTYYWRVRAVLGTAASYSDWSAIVGFTTMAKPVAPTPPVIIEPTPPAPPAPVPTTPAYIYAIIAIGAVLVIVVIVLIVRTRRP